MDDGIFVGAVTIVGEPDFGDEVLFSLAGDCAHTPDEKKANAKIRPTLRAMVLRFILPGRRAAKCLYPSCRIEVFCSE